MTNDELQLIVKDILTSTGGQLSNDQLTSFIESGVEVSPILKDEFQVEQVTATTMDIDILEVASRILRKSVEGSEFTTKTGITIKRRQLTPVEMKLRWNISDKFLRRNVSREAANGQIQSLMSKRALLDLLDLAINGDTTDVGADKDFLNILNGILVKFDDDADAPVKIPFVADDKATKIFTNLIKDMPKDFRGDRTALRFFMSPEKYDSYIEELEARNTPLGDQVITGNVILPYKGIKIVTPSRWPDDKVVLTLSKNFAIGYGMDAMLESQRNIFSSSTDFVMTMEADANYAISQAVRMAEQN